MPGGASFDQQRCRQALRKRLALDYQPLRGTLSKGLGIHVDPEAAVFSTAVVEAFCDFLFTTTIKQLSEAPGPLSGPHDTKITVFHLQVALRSHPEMSGLLQRAESAQIALGFFLDDATSRALYERKLIPSREAKHLDTSSPRYDYELEEGGSGRSGRRAQQRATQEAELIKHHERTRSEWQKREDDPFSEVDFAMVLKCVHPAFTLSYNATMLLSALVRELLNEVCSHTNVDALQRRHPRELLLEDLQAPFFEVFCNTSTIEVVELDKLSGMAAQIRRTASECLDRFRLRSHQGRTLNLLFRVYLPTGSSALQPLHALTDVPRDTPFAKLSAQMRSKCHLPASTAQRGGTFSNGDFIAIYRAHQVEAVDTPDALAMTSGAVIFLVARRWWDLTRRTEARRGLLASQRPQDSLVRSLVAGTESKVKKELHAAGVSEDFPAQRLHPKRALASTRSPDAVANCSCSVSKSASRQPAAQVEAEEDSLSILLRERAARRAQAAETAAGKAKYAGEEKPLALDQSWSEFAAMSAVVCRTSERLAQWTRDAGNETVKTPPTFQELEELEKQWRERVRYTEDLVTQTRKAHQLASRLLGRVRRAMPSVDPTS